MDIKTSEFFRNMKNIPPKPSIDKMEGSEFKQLVDWEVEKCLGGVNINGVHITGWLYWHLNHWNIKMNLPDAYGNIVRYEGLPHLRDNEWIRAEAYEECRKMPMKGFMEIGGRRGGKSEFEGSIIGYNSNLFKGSQNVVVGGNDGDLATIKEKIEFGIKKLWEGIAIPRLDKNWRQPLVKLGYKQKDQEDDVWSFIAIRNVSDGKNTEGPAGLTAKSFIIDECGKFMFGSAYAAAKPSFLSEYGQMAVPIIVGTGGAFEKGGDAERFFYNPDANNFLGFNDPETGERTCLFLSGLYRYDCKEDSTLADYLLSQGRITPGQDISELLKIPMKVSNKIFALNQIKESRALKAMDPDQTEYLKEIMYFPLTPKECFLTDSVNFFNTEIAKNQSDKLREEYPGLKIGMYVELVQEGDKIIHKPSHKLPVSSFPRKGKENTNCPIVIIEHPLPDPPYGLYVAGIDPYRFEKAMTSDSLGAIYIFKRSHDVLSDKFQDMPVAWYVGRPDSKDDWNKNVMLLIKYYNVVALCENDEMSFIDYMMREGEGHRLMDTPQWIKDYSPNSSSNLRQKGVSASPRNIELFNTNLKQYMEEVFASVPIPGSEETKKILGVNKVMDPMLLEEVIKWNKDGNFDRIRALSIAITCARKMDTERVTVTLPSEQKAQQKPRQPKPMFRELGNTYKYKDARTQLQRLLK